MIRAAATIDGAAARCWHCEESIPADCRFVANTAGGDKPVCCLGCKAAAEWIEQLGLSDYYRLRSAPAQRPVAEDAVDQSIAASAAVAGHAVHDLGGGRREVLMSIDGVRCAACVWLIERTLAGIADIERVEVNASSRRARIVWSGALALPRIIEILKRIGYTAVPLRADALDESRRKESRDAQKRLLVAGFGAMQAMMYASAVYLGVTDHMDDITRDLFRWLELLVATPVVFYSARPFFAGALRSLRARVLGMDVPVALAVVLIYAASVIQSVRGGGEVYFESVSMFVFFLLIGRYLEMRARHRTVDLTDALARLTPSVANRLGADGSPTRVDVLELVPGDRLQVYEGGLVPADGTLDSASCSVNEALLSGESAAQPKRRGDRMLAGSVLEEGPAEMTVAKVGKDTIVAGIAILVARAQASRPRLARAGERASAQLVIRVLVVSLLTAFGWALVDPGRVFGATVAVLVVSCPCAFALATPAAVTRALTMLARRGVLVAKPDAIEVLAHATHVVFDKTGTLTDPHLALSGIRSFGGMTQAMALELAGALAQQSNHPSARAIRSATPEPGLRASDVVVTAGGGVAGRIGERRLRLGSPAFAIGPLHSGEEWHGAVVLADDRGVLAAFHLGERLRPEAAAAVERLSAQGLHIAILSGDAPNKVRAAAAALGVAQWRARQSPADKLARLNELRAEGSIVIAVGDGINDGPVLAGADVGVALTGGADLALAASDLVLAADNLQGVAWARDIARQTLRVIRQNQYWAWIYNAAAVPAAALGFVPPWLAALGMSLSSLVVVLNALRIDTGRQPQRTLSAAGKTLCASAP